MNTLFTYLVIFVAEKVNCMAGINVKLVDKSDKATLYTICFEGEDISEFEKFLMKFKDNAELRRDYQIILLAVKKILAYIIHSGFISGYQNRYGDNLKPPTNVYHRMTA